jgi:hypothetical protein
MTRQQALKAAQALLGKRAAVEALPKGARIGLHGEFVKSHMVNNRPDDPKKGRYRCQRCSTAIVDEANDYVERDIWHLAGGWQMAYRVGYIDNFVGAFHIRAEADSFEAALEKLKPQPKASAA